MPGVGSYGPGGRWIHAASLVAFFDGLEKVAVSKEWVVQKIRSALKRGVIPARHSEFADKMYEGVERTFDQGGKTRNWRLNDLYGEALDYAQKYNPRDYKPSMIP